jgi:hypothetical protein
MGSKMTIKFRSSGLLAAAALLLCDAVQCDSRTGTRTARHNHQVRGSNRDARASLQNRRLYHHEQSGA